MLAYQLLQWTILKTPGGSDVLGAAVGGDWKGKLAPLLYAAAIGLAFVNRWLACGLYVLVAMMWLIPDRRIERALAKTEEE